VAEDPDKMVSIEVRLCSVAGHGRGQYFVLATRYASLAPVAVIALLTTMTVHSINPSHVSFGIGVITPRWLYVLASATPPVHRQPRLVDETLEPLDPTTIRRGDVVGIGIHTGNALRGYEIGAAARAAGAFVVFGGIHATLYPEEALELGGAHAVVTGDGEEVWARGATGLCGATPSSPEV
jgi:hypothetical protein